MGLGELDMAAKNEREKLCSTLSNLEPKWLRRPHLIDVYRSYCMLNTKKPGNTDVSSFFTIFLDSRALVGTKKKQIDQIDIQKNIPMGSV